MPRLNRKKINPDSDLGVYLRLLSYGYDQKKYFAIALFGMMLFSATDLGFAALMKPLLDENLLHKNGDFTLIALIVVGALFARGVGSYLSITFLAFVSQAISKEFRRKAFHHMLRLGIPYFEAHKPGELITKITYNTAHASTAVSKGLTVLIRDTLTVTALLSWMFYLSWMLTLILLLASPFIAAVFFHVSKRFRKSSERLQTAAGSMTNDIEQMVRGIRVIKIFGNSEFECEGFDKSNEYTRKQNIKFARTRAMFTPAVLFIIGTFLAIAIYMLNLENVYEHTTAGSLASFFVSLIMIMRPIRNLTSIHSVIQQGVVSARSTFNMLAIAPEYVEHNAGEKKGVEQGIIFAGVNYQYPNQQRSALKNINLEIPAKKMIALVGHSGAGKTTLVNMLPRFYEAQSGRITIDGKDIMQMALPELRQYISYVGQEVVLFHDTVRNNITYGQQVEESVLQKAMQEACVDEFVKNLPQGIETQIGEGGNKLSGGQCQRLSIARALLKSAPIVIFDEATSFLDSRTELVIKNALANIIGHSTLIVIAHRLSTVEQADIIVVMDDGEIVETGTHKELLALRGKYYRLYQAGQSTMLIE